MEHRRPPEHHLEITADRASVRDVVKGILHTIFFHRYFTPLYPATHDILDITLPYVSEDDIANLVDARANTLVRQLEASFSASALGGTSMGYPHSASSPSSPSPRPGRGTIVVQFLEKKRRKGWFVAKADEETVWECWVVDVTVLGSAAGSGDAGGGGGGGGGTGGGNFAGMEAARARRVMERSVQRAALQIVTAVNRERAHIPPITSNETNPFPYQILVNPKPDSWGQKMGIF